jgi:hypothetical protein
VFRHLLPLALLCGPALGSSPDPQSLAVGKDDLARAKKLVGQLGDPRFVAREKAQRELEDMGRKALAPLATGAADSADPEVRLRCRKLIPHARADDFQARVDTFLADTEGKFKHDLPGLDVFFDATGKNESARKLYLEILGREENRKLLADAETDPAGLPTVVQNRAMTLYYRQYPRNMAGAQFVPGSPPDFRDVITLLLVDAKVPADKQNRRAGVQSPSYQLNNASFRTSLQGSGPEAELSRKVVGHWLDSRVEGYDLYMGMTVLLNTNLKDEAMRAAKKLLASHTAPGSYRGLAMTTLARTIGKDAVPFLLPCLTDETVCVTMAVAVNGVANRVDIQTRDVALACLVSATEQKITDYGFTGRGGNVISYSTQYFESDEARKKGFKKWAEWAKANPKALEVKAEKK